MSKPKDLELLDRFTKALESKKGVAREVGSDGNVYLHVMPDRIIEAIRNRIKDLNLLINEKKRDIQTNAACRAQNYHTKAETQKGIDWRKKHLTIPIYEDNREERKSEIVQMSNDLVSYDNIIKHCDAQINSDQLEIAEIAKTINRYEELIFRLLAACIGE